MDFATLKVASEELSPGSWGIFLMMLRWGIWGVTAGGAHICHLLLVGCNCNWWSSVFLYSFFFLRFDSQKVSFRVTASWHHRPSSPSPPKLPRPLARVVRRPAARLALRFLPHQSGHVLGWVCEKMTTENEVETHDLLQLLELLLLSSTPFCYIYHWLWHVSDRQCTPWKSVSTLSNTFKEHSPTSTSFTWHKHAGTS